jgi:hypothetical protein
VSHGGDRAPAAARVSTDVDHHLVAFGLVDVASVTIAG